MCPAVALDYPLGLISFEGDLALVLIRAVLEVHCDAVLELEHDQPIVYDFAAINGPRQFPILHNDRRNSVNWLAGWR